MAFESSRSRAAHGASAARRRASLSSNAKLKLSNVSTYSPPKVSSGSACCAHRVSNQNHWHTMCLGAGANALETSTPRACTGRKHAVAREHNNRTRSLDPASPRPCRCMSRGSLMMLMSDTFRRFSCSQREVIAARCPCASERGQSSKAEGNPDQLAREGAGGTPLAACLARRPGLSAVRPLRCLAFPTPRLSSWAVGGQQGSRASKEGCFAGLGSLQPWFASATTPKRSVGFAQEGFR